MHAEFEDWVRVTSPALLRAAFLLCGDRHSSEDLVQVTLERVGMAWRRIDDHPDAYARAVMYRSYARWWRRRGRRESVMAAPPVSAAEDHAGLVERRVVVQAALAQLTRSQRAVLVLRYYEDLSERDTAAVLGCSVGAVKSQRHKALLRYGTPRRSSGCSRERR